MHGLFDLEYRSRRKFSCCFLSGLEHGKKAVPPQIASVNSNVRKRRAQRYLVPGMQQQYDIILATIAHTRILLTCLLLGVCRRAQRYVSHCVIDIGIHFRFLCRDVWACFRAALRLRFALSLRARRSDGLKWLRSSPHGGNPISNRFTCLLSWDGTRVNLHHGFTASLLPGRGGTSQHGAGGGYAPLNWVTPLHFGQTPPRCLLIRHLSSRFSTRSQRLI